MSQPTSLPWRQDSTPVPKGMPQASIDVPSPRQAFPATHVFDWGEAWRRQAGCRETDPALFFPTGTTGSAQADIAAAKAVCARCEVREACLEFAMATNQDAGIWGGRSEDERRQLRRGSMTGPGGRE